MPKLTLEQWVAERLQNCERIANVKNGTERDGWLEDADYFRQILERLRASDKCDEES